MSDAEITETPFRFESGVVGHRKADGAYVLECPKCGWQREGLSKYAARQDARAHLCPRPGVPA